MKKLNSITLYAFEFTSLSQFAYYDKIDLQLLYSQLINKILALFWRSSDKLSIVIVL